MLAAEKDKRGADVAAGAAWGSPVVREAFRTVTAVTPGPRLWFVKCDGFTMLC